MIVGCTLDYYIIYVLLLKVTTKGQGQSIISCIKKKTKKKTKKKKKKKKKKQKKTKKKNKKNDDNKNVDKFDFVASLT